MERRKGWSEEGEESLSGGLIEKKSDAGQYRLCSTERQISHDLYGQTILVDTKGVIYDMEKADSKCED